MNNIPSKSLSKSVLVVTPLFLLVLAILHASSEVSYLFILKFITNTAGNSDITFLPNLQTQMDYNEFVQYIREGESNTEKAMNQKVNFPGVNLTELQIWSESQSTIKGISPRWIVPIKTGKNDAVLMVLNTTREKELGLINEGTLGSIGSKEIAIQTILVDKMGVQLGDVVPITFQPKNIMNGLKLLQKYTGMGSDQEFIPSSSQTNVPIQSILPLLLPLFPEQKRPNSSELQQVLERIFESSVEMNYTLVESYYPQGIYPSAIANVIIMQFSGFTNLISQWILNTVVDIANDENLDIYQYIDESYRNLVPKDASSSKLLKSAIDEQISETLKRYSLMAACSINNREQVYHPDQGQQYKDFLQSLETVPSTVQLVVIAPFFTQSLAIKYFFDSVIQIFEFVTFIIYFYTITLIMKQIYEQKEVEVGIWRTLGAGAVAKKKQQKHDQVQLRDVNDRGHGLNYSSKFHNRLDFVQSSKFLYQIATKVGFAYYWIITTFASVVIYVIIKQIFYASVCAKLQFNLIPQPLSTPLIIFGLNVLFLGIVIFSHIKTIYTNPLSETIKPVKRTFDVVKVRVIHIATFGVTVEVLLLSIMLIYYGVVSYYWIPFAVLDNQQDLQVLLFNTIFLFMIFGSIILLSIFQSKMEEGVFSVLFSYFPKINRMKSSIRKSIKSKKYKNIKVSIIVSIIFAFVLFFTSGIKIQMSIIQSFVERALGSELVFENYQRKTFDDQKIQQFLNGKQGIDYAWLSKGLSRDNVTITLISHISGSSVKPQFQYLSSSYLNSTFYQYYYPETYIDGPEYPILPNSVMDGFGSIYKGKESTGNFQSNDTITQIDPYNIGVGNQKQDWMRFRTQMAPQQQVINLVVSSSLRKELGVQVGSYYKMRIENKQINKSFYTRARIVHSFKAGPGFDLLGSKAFMSQQQAKYIYETLDIEDGVVQEKQKLFIKGNSQDIKALSPSIIAMSPQHTQMFEVEFVSQSFKLLQKYLDMYVVLITTIMSFLLTIFIFLYTVNKCREEASMYKMLRAVGLTVEDIRLAVFLEVIIRLTISIINGILLGIVFSLGFSLQIQEFLMIKTPPMDITIVTLIGLVLIGVFCGTVTQATKYLTKRTVASTDKN